MHIYVFNGSSKTISSKTKPCLKKFYCTFSTCIYIKNNFHFACTTIYDTSVYRSLHLFDITSILVARLYSHRQADLFLIIFSLIIVKVVKRQKIFLLGLICSTCTREIWRLLPNTLYTHTQFIVLSTSVYIYIPHCLFIIYSANYAFVICSLSIGCASARFAFLRVRTAAFSAFFSAKCAALSSGPEMNDALSWLRRHTAHVCLTQVDRMFM